MQKLKLTKKYEKYPEYKDSGVEWIGKIPKGWSVATSRRLFITKKDRVGFEFGNYKILSLTLNGVIPKVLDGSGKNPAEYDTYQVFNKNDLVFCLFDYDVTPRTIGYVEENGMMTGAYTRLIPQKETFSRYYYYYFLSLDFSKELLHLCTGLRNSLSKPVFWSLLNPFPSADIQKKISDYLDQKISSIDQIIEKKRKMIELLKEKRVTVINHAVMRGVDSEIEFIKVNTNGFTKIPKSWTLQKMKFLAKKPLQYGANEAGLDDNRNHPRFIRITDIDEAGSLRQDVYKSLDPELAKPYLLEDGDILFARTGGTVGKSFKYKIEWGTCCYAGYLIRMNVDQKKISSDYLEYVTKSDYYWKWIDSIFIRSTIQNVSAEKYKDFLVALPPVKDQQKILSFLDSKIPAFEEGIRCVEKTISLLQEFKSSLIANAVTGKIRV